MSNKILWSSSLERLYQGKKVPQSVKSLTSAGYHQIESLLWIIPLKRHLVPSISPFTKISRDTYFNGIGRVIHVGLKPQFHTRGKGGQKLFHATVVLQDYFSKQSLQLKWFNLYPSKTQILKKLEWIHFWGQVKQFGLTLEIHNPQYSEMKEAEIEAKIQALKPQILIQYPTVNGVSPHHLKNIIHKIPRELWDHIEENLPEEIRHQRNFYTLQESFKIIHGKQQANEQQYQQALSRLIYEEFFSDQVKVLKRKEEISHMNGVSLVHAKGFQNFYKLLEKRFPYRLTGDQEMALREIFRDLESPSPMMRLLQGDVGSGKTTVAIGAAELCLENQRQVAIMCPTETLAKQLFENFSKFLPERKGELIIGSLTKKEKLLKADHLKSGKCEFVVGTHALIEDTISFKKLGLIIIDEQHKFGVNQRLKIFRKQEGVNCLVMSATPIPRSLSLTHYGDLEMTIMKHKPLNAKEIQTRIVLPETFPKYLSFVKTRLSMQEQAYVVVPAIQESERANIHDLEKITERFKKWFPEQRVEFLHGQLKAGDKDHVYQSFKKGEIDILVSTSVIEVGIDVPNATSISIFSPQQFGLSALHQLRGRVGRAGRPGFCFLPIEQTISKQSLERLKVLEASQDGFLIAEEDLKLRGEGDLFGVEQSGEMTHKKIGHIVHDFPLLEKARADYFVIKNDFPKYLHQRLEKLDNLKITSTI